MVLLDYLKRIDLMKTFTGILMLCVFSYMVFHITDRELPEGNREIIIHILGIIEGVVMSIVTYYFGSSKGSQEKAATISKHIVKPDELKNQ